MKKYIVIFFIIAGILITSQLKSQVVIKVRPAKPNVVVMKPQKPGTRHIWIDGHWKWNKKRKEYVWIKGYWTQPKKGQKWIPGHWVKVPGGHKWVPGHWARI